MADLSNYTIAGYGCDAKACKAEVRGEYMSWVTGVGHYRRLADAQGWTFWASRGTRAYCADHGPKPGHRMTRIEVKR